MKQSSLGSSIYTQQGKVRSPSPTLKGTKIGASNVSLDGWVPYQGMVGVSDSARTIVALHA